MIYADKAQKPKVVRTERHIMTADEAEESWNYAQGRENRQSDDNHMNGF